MAEVMAESMEDDISTVDNSSDCEPPSKILKRFRGASTYRTKYNREWEKTYPFVRPVHGDPHAFRCSVCLKNIRCAHQGIADVKSHIKSVCHQKLSKNMASQPRLSFSSHDSLTDKVYLINFTRYIYTSDKKH